MLPPATHVLLVTHLPLIHILIILVYTVSCNAEELKVALPDSYKMTVAYEDRVWLNLLI